MVELCILMIGDGEGFRHLAEALPHLVWTCRGDGACDYLSPQWVAYTGIAANAQLDDGWLDQLHPDDLELTKSRWAAAAVAGTTFDTEFRIRRSDGAYRWFKTRAVPVLSPQGVIRAWVGTNTDVQDLHDANEASSRAARELEARVEARTAELAAAHERLVMVAAQLQAAQRITHVGSWQLDVRTNAVVWSDELFRIMGMEPRASAPDYPAQVALFAPESWDRLAAAVAHSIATGDGYELDLGVICVDGTRQRTIARAETIRDSSGAISHLVGTLQDVTEGEQIAMRLRLLTERLQLATSAAEMGVWDWDVASNTLVWDDTMYRLYGVEPNGPLEPYETWRAAVDANEIAQVEQQLADALAGRADFATTFQISQPNGSRRYLRAAARAYVDPETGKPGRMVGVNWDITQQRLAEIALHRNEAFQRAILQNAGAAIIASEIDGTIISFNPAAEVLLGYAASELVGVTNPGVFHDPAEVDARRLVLEVELATSITDPFEVFVTKARIGTDVNEWTYVCKDGSRVPVLLTVSSIRDDRDAIVGYLGVAVDLTQRKRVELELVSVNRLLAERSKQREVLLQEVHHRVKNNLQVIASLVNMQIRQLGDSAARAALNECRTRIQAIALVHEQLYKGADYSQLPFSDYAKMLVRNIAEAVGAIERGLRLETDIDPVVLLVDRAIPLGLILNELVTNSLKHAFPNGKRGRIRIGVHHVADRIRLTVSDDGVGLPPATEAKSRSLGMQLVAALVDQLGGVLEIPRDSGGGATFVVSILA